MCASVVTWVGMPVSRANRRNRQLASFELRGVAVEDRFPRHAVSPPQGVTGGAPKGYREDRPVDS